MIDDTASTASQPTKSFWLQALQTVGFPTVACIAITWFAYDAIRWERETMIPAITSNTKTQESVQDSLDRLNIQLQHGTHVMQRTQRNAQSE